MHPLKYPKGPLVVACCAHINAHHPEPPTRSLAFSPSPREARWTRQGCCWGPRGSRVRDVNTRPSECIDELRQTLHTLLPPLNSFPSQTSPTPVHLAPTHTHPMSPILLPSSFIHLPPTTRSTASSWLAAALRWWLCCAATACLMCSLWATVG